MIKDIKRYLIYTFSFSWIFWGIAIILTQTHAASYGSPMMLISYMLGGLSPAICEIYLKKKYGDKEDFRAFIKNIIYPKYNFLWYIFIIITAFIICYLPVLFGGAEMAQPLYMAFAVLPLMIFGGGLEEIGWRGFLQPALQKRMPAYASTLLLSVIWAVWHLPLWFVVGTAQESMNFLAFIITVTALSFVLAALYNSTKSIFLCIIMHAFINGFWEVYVSTDNVLSNLPTLVFCIIIFIVAEMLMKKTKLFVENKKRVAAG